MIHYLVRFVIVVRCSQGNTCVLGVVLVAIVAVAVSLPCIIGGFVN